jgi:hypothetical protein
LKCHLNNGLRALLLAAFNGDMKQMEEAMMQVGGNIGKMRIDI